MQTAIIIEFKYLMCMAILSALGEQTGQDKDNSITQWHVVLLMAAGLCWFPMHLIAFRCSLWMERRPGIVVWPARERIAHLQRRGTRVYQGPTLADGRQLRRRGQCSRCFRRSGRAAGGLGVASDTIGQTFDIFQTGSRAPRRRRRHPKLIFAGKPAPGLIITGNGESWSAVVLL